MYTKFQPFRSDSGGYTDIRTPQRLHKTTFIFQNKESRLKTKRKCIKKGGDKEKIRSKQTWPEE
jgi:hypothetical protein